MAIGITSRDIKDGLDCDFILSKLARAKADYADFRLSSAQSSSVRVKDGEVEPSTSTSSGISCRVLISGSWGFASSNRSSKKDAEGLLEKASRLALLSKGKERLSHDKFPSRKVFVKTKAKEAPADIDISEKASRCLELEKSMKLDKVSNTNVVLADSCANKLFMNSEGAFIEQEATSLYLSLSAVAKGGGTMQTGHETIGNRGGYELIRNADGKAEEAARKAARLLSAKAPKKGKCAIVVDGKMAGVFAHEALGHAAEADAVLSDSSILKWKLGARIGSPLVTIVDDATAEGFGRYAFDDEGIPGQRKVLVDKGIFRGYLHSRSTAGEMKALSTGSCRAASYADFPIVRMSNTLFGKGKHSHSEIFDVREGVYLKGMKGGSVEPLSGTFMFTAEEGYEIRNGELGALLRDATLSGNVLETLHRVVAVGKDFGGSPGFCGKMGQSMPVSDGGPHMRISEMLVG